MTMMSGMTMMFVMTKLFVITLRVVMMVMMMGSVPPFFSRLKWRRGGGNEGKKKRGRGGKGGVHRRCEERRRPRRPEGDGKASQRHRRLSEKNFGSIDESEEFETSRCLEMRNDITLFFVEMTIFVLQRRCQIDDYGEGESDDDEALPLCQLRRHRWEGSRRHEEGGREGGEE